MKNISGWKKAIIVMAIFNVLIVFIDLIVIFFYGPQIRLSAAWLFGSEDKTTLSSLLFIEGALIIGVGALLAGGFAENRMHPTNVPSTPYTVEKISKQRSEFREEQISTGLLLMLAGVPLVILSILSAVA
ncbi:MAG: hypothetical protein O2V44_09185 [Candidatus Bathyarchaeota archaeon]|nr:hypothetical protein [Candidatus Bathyarchaeota archaeon]